MLSFRHCCSLALTLLAGLAAAEPPAGFRQDFEGAEPLKGWVCAGNVAVDGALGFKSGASLRMARTLQRVEEDTSAIAPALAVVPGTWEVSGALATELVTPDSSYNVMVTVDWQGADGKPLDPVEVAMAGGQQAWRPFRKRIEPPLGATSARVRVILNKAHGVCHIDDLALAFVNAEVRKPELIERFTYASASICNILRPTDKLAVTVTVEAYKPLSAEQRRLTFQVRDYWGAEVGEPGGVALAPVGAGKNARDRFAYSAELDLSNVGLEVGKYYEVHTRVDLPGLDVAQDRTTLAILPEAPSKKYAPLEIPFTSRNWDHRLDMHPLLSDRIGLRVCGIWGGFPVEAPGNTFMPQFESAEKLGMAMLTGVPSHAIENHTPGYEKWTVEAMRVGTRALLATYGQRGLRMIDLGNEPPGLEERAREALPFYKAIYEEVKKFDATIQVLGTSVGPCEAYFKAGFQDVLDVFDFHVYEDVPGIRNIFAEYERLFAKYKCRKPIVATELGLNSQGLPRLAITNDLIRKLSVFFALGGLHCSWFDLFYPDPKGVITGSNGDSFNAFNCKYESYSPRLDALAYYNMVNGILVKKCLGEKLYPNGVLATLFKDDKGACFMSLYADKGRHDVFLPLPGTGAVKVLRIDGSAVVLDAGGKGVTLSIAQDALLLSWQGGASALPTELGEPVASLMAEPASVVKGSAVALTLAMNTLPVAAVTVKAPRGWTVGKPVVGSANGKNTATWSLGAPTVTSAREARVAIALAKAGEIYLGIPVTGQVSLRVLPTIQKAEGAAGVSVGVRNNGREPQRVALALSLMGEYLMAKNNFDPAKPTPTQAFFADVPETSLLVEPGAERLFSVALNGLDPQTIYRVRALATDASGITLTRERNLAGFANAPRARAAPKLDGVLDEADWRRAQVLKIHEERQFWGYGERTWRGLKDVSGELRVLWDDQFLYVGVTVVDDVFRNQKQDVELWAGDGLQFLFDPCREAPEKIGKYDYGIGYGTKGAQAWCWYSADVRAPSGAVPNIRIAAKAFTDGSGGKTYEVAFPWERLAPFQPAAGRNLGMAMILNDDDGVGRDCYSGWFSGVSTKEVDVVGDVILGE